MRMHAQTAMIENGLVYIPQSAPWLAEYLHEMTVFPNGKHDDQVDSTAQFLDRFKRPFPGWNMYELYRRQALALQERNKPQPVQQTYAPGSMEWTAAINKQSTIGQSLDPARQAGPLRQRTSGSVRLRAPRGIGAVYTFSGRYLNVGEDGTVEMPAEDAQYLIRDGWTQLAERDSAEDV